MALLVRGRRPRDKQRAGRRAVRELEPTDGQGLLSIILSSHKRLQTIERLLSGDAAPEQQHKNGRGLPNDCGIGLRAVVVEQHCLKCRLSDIDAGSVARNGSRQAVGPAGVPLFAFASRHAHGDVRLHGNEIEALCNVIVATAQRVSPALAGVPKTKEKATNAVANFISLEPARNRISF